MVSVARALVFGCGLRSESEEGGGNAPMSKARANLDPIALLKELDEEDTDEEDDLYVQAFSKAGSGHPSRLSAACLGWTHASATSHNTNLAAGRFYSEAVRR